MQRNAGGGLKAQYAPAPAGYAHPVVHTQSEYSYAQNNMYSKPPGYLGSYLGSSYNLYTNLPLVNPGYTYQGIKNYNGPRYTPPKLVKHYNSDKYGRSLDTNEQSSRSQGNARAAPAYGSAPAPAYAAPAAPAYAPAPAGKLNKCQNLSYK